MNESWMALARNLLTGAAVLLTLSTGMLTYQLHEAQSRRDFSHHAVDVLSVTSQLAIAVRDTETSQRGFLLTGREEYLTPFNTAVPRVDKLEADLGDLLEDSLAQKEMLRHLKPLIQAKIDEIGETIELRRTKGLEAAMEVVNTDRGRHLMDSITGNLLAIRREEHRQLSEYEARTRAADQLFYGLLVVAALAFALVILWQRRRKLLAFDTLTRSRAREVDASFAYLDQGVAVFEAGGELQRWNAAFSRTLNVPSPMLHIGALYDDLAKVAGLADDDHPFLVPVTPESAPRFNEDTVTYVSRRYGDPRPVIVRLTRLPTGGFIVSLTPVLPSCPEEQTRPFTRSSSK